MRSILGQEAANAAKEAAAAAASTATSKRGRRSAASKRSSPKEESNKENRRKSTADAAVAGALGRLQSSAEDIVKNADAPENAVVEVQFVTNQVPAKRVNAQLGELKKLCHISDKTSRYSGRSQSYPTGNGGKLISS